jgi:hypothetical protein
LNGIAGATDRALTVAGSRGNGLDGLGRGDADRAGVLGRRCRGRGAVGGVVDRRAGGGIADGDRLGAGVRTAERAEGGRATAM